MEKLTRNDIKRIAAYGNIYYTNMNKPELKYLDKIGYNSGVYGWNFDVYKLGCSVLLVGYRVPSYAERINDESLDNFVVKYLERKIKNIDYEKNILLSELSSFKEQLKEKK